MEVKGGLECCGGGGRDYMNRSLLSVTDGGLLPSLFSGG